jgi:signal transduction histidine kinase
MGGVFLAIAYTYKLQKQTEEFIESSRISVSTAKEMGNELIAIKGLTYTYLVNKSEFWLDSLNNRKTNFIIHLERARRESNTSEEESLVNQVSALFSNFEQSIHQAVLLYKMGDVTESNAILAYSAKDLLETIQNKSNEFLSLNFNAELFHENELAKTNALVLKILIWVGLVSIVLGVTIGWLISHMLFSPINQLVLTVRGASGEAVFEEFSVQPTSELEELGERIKKLIERINRANEDLSKNKMLLQHSNKFANLGKIAPTIAHEIRNPLASIKMLVYSIGEEENIPASVKEDLNIISREIDRMEKFTKDFLKFAKPADPNFSEINPLESLQEIIKLLSPRLKKNRIVLNDNQLKSNCTVLADMDQLKQIYMNIILNAIEVMPNGGELRVNSETISLSDAIQGSKNCLKISFIDSGPGIPIAIFDNVFEPFIKGADLGVGIGLSISQSIAQSHGGWIKAENNSIGQGATFSLFLPIQ